MSVSGSIFSSQKVVFPEIGVFFFDKSLRKGGLFLYMENTDGLPLIRESGGAGNIQFSVRPSHGYGGVVLHKQTTKTSPPSHQGHSSLGVLVDVVPAGIQPRRLVTTPGRAQSGHVQARRT